MKSRTKSHGKNDHDHNYTSKNKGNRNSRSIHKFKTEEDEFYENIMEIDLTKPKSAYTLFVVDYHQSLPENEKKNITELTSKISEKWKATNKTTREKYIKKAVEDKHRYDLHLAKVKKYLINPDRIKEHSSAYNLFRDAYVYEEMLKNKVSKKEAVTLAREAYKHLSEEEKDEWRTHYENEKKTMNSLGDYKPGKVNSYTEFIHDKVKNERMDLEHARHLWEKSSKSEKEKYEKLAEEANHEKDKLRDLYDMISGEAPKRPVGSFGLFLAEKAGDINVTDKENIIKKVRELWVDLPQSEKEDYERKHKAISLKYEIKKAEYLKHRRALKPKNVSGYNLFQAEFAKTMRDKKGDDYVYGRGEFFAETSKAWANCNEKTKEEYNNKAREINEDNKEKSQILYNPPVKPLTVYATFIKEHLEKNKKKYEGLSQGEKFKKAAEVWSKVTDKEKEQFNEKYEQAKEKYDDEIMKYAEELQEYEKNNTGRSKSKSKLSTYIQSQRLKSQTKLISSKSKSQNAITALNKSKSKHKDHAHNTNNTNTNTNNNLNNNTNTNNNSNSNNRKSKSKGKNKK